MPPQSLPSRHPCRRDCLSASPMRPLCVVLDPPRLDCLSRLLQWREPVGVEASRLKLPIEGFRKGIVGKFTGAGDLQLYPVSVGLDSDGFRDELPRVVDGDSFRTTDGPLNRSRTPTTRSPVTETPTSIAGLTRLTVSTLVKTRERGPSVRPSVRKSRLLGSSGCVTGGGKTRNALASYFRRFT
jgi:hypothetical protein